MDSNSTGPEAGSSKKQNRAIGDWRKHIHEELKIVRSYALGAEPVGSISRGRPWKMGVRASDEGLESEPPTNCHYVPGEPGEEPPAATADSEPVANGPVGVLAFHGMGQQVRFETLSDMAGTILDGVDEDSGQVQFVAARPLPRVGVGGQMLVRLEIAWLDSSGILHEIHIYEAYWAPLTEGQITYWETVRFLLNGAGNGLRFSLPGKRGTFERMLFGKLRQLKIGNGTFVSIVLILLFLLLQVGVIAAAGTASASILKQLADAYSTGVKESLLSGFTAVFHCARVNLVSLSGLALFLLIGEAYLARKWIVQFVGDVAAYVSPYKVSKFDELRGKIQAVGLEAARAIFDGYRTSPWFPKYQKVLFVGHSLGAVIAYDTLNAMINLDTASLPPRTLSSVVKRTRALITFGAPLDKTAFLFRVQFKAKNQKGIIRELGSTAVQPLISEVKYRFNGVSGPEWINIWSPMDIIGGKLVYYDPDVPPGSDCCIKNVIDWHAWVPILAHVQYWKDSALRKAVFELL